MCTVSHTMNCFPVVTVINSSGEQVYPKITIVDGQTFTMDFECAMSIPESSPWTCVITYGSEYGNSEVIATELTNNLLESQKYASDAAEAATAAIQARDAASSSVATVQSIYDIIVNPEIVTIPPASSAYSLVDPTSAANGHAWHYFHAPTQQITTYTLPDVTEPGAAHEILLDVDFFNSQEIRFADSDGNIIPTQDEVLANVGDKYRFVCMYQFGTWIILPVRLRVAFITAVDQVTVTGTSGTAIADTQLVAVADTGEAVTFAMQNGPSGISCSSSGLLTGTPTAAGTTTATVTASSRYASSVPISVTFVIS